MILEQDGLVIEVRYHEWHPYWVDCCGTVPPKTEEGKVLMAINGKAEMGKAVCSGCGELRPYRQNTVPTELKYGRGRCMKSCHNGKSNGYCSCICRGRCHGQGSCKEKANVD